MIEGLDDIIRLVCDIIVGLCHLSGLGSILRKLWYLDEVEVGHGVGWVLTCEGWFELHRGWEFIKLINNNKINLTIDLKQLI